VDAAAASTGVAMVGNVGRVGRVVKDGMTSIQGRAAGRIEDAADAVIDNRRVADSLDPESGAPTIVLSDKQRLLAEIAARDDVERIIQVPVGSKGDWDSRINTGVSGRLESNTAYMLDNGHVYVTDANGLVKEVNGQLSLQNMDRNGYQQRCAGHSGCSTDHGGHLLASSLGGAGDRINMVPMDSTLNLGSWRAMENFLRSELNAGKKVEVSIEIGYPAGGGVRPNLFVVNAFVDGQKRTFRHRQ